MSDEKNKRIAALKQMLQARTDAEGNPLPGYKNNVIAIQAELSQLEGVTDAA